MLLPDDENLTPGQFGEAQFVLGSENVIVVPVSALTERAGIEGVFVKDASNKLYFRSVRLGKSWQPGSSQPGSSQLDSPQLDSSQPVREVLAGLEVEALVVINPSSLLRDGDSAR